MARTTPTIVAVTGASGFIGAHVVLALLQRGYTVHACVRDAADAKNAFLPALAKTHGGTVKLFSALLLDEGAYDAAFAGAHGVIHVAAVLSIDGSADPVKDMVEPSTRGTANVLRSVARCGVLHYVHTSSSAAVYDAKKGAMLDETDWNPDPFVPGAGMDSYPFAKTEAEKAVWEMVKGQPFTATCINPTMVWGPCLAKPHAKASPFVFRQALYGNVYPNTPMSVVDVRDVAVAHVEAMERHGRADGKRFVLDGGADTAPTNEHMRVAARLFPQYTFTFSAERDPPTRAQHPLGYLRRQWDNSLSVRLLGLRYIPREQCIKDTVSSMVETGWVPARPKAKL